MSYQELVRYFWTKKFWIISFCSLAAIASIVFTFSLSNIYRADALLAPQKDDGNSALSKLGSQFGGLASIAGVSLESGQSDEVELALEVMLTRSFILGFIEKYKIKEKLLAAKGWDANTNKVLYDTGKYNPDIKEWQPGAFEYNQKVPSNFETYQYFLKNTFGFERDMETGMIRMSIRHYSPYLAKEILDNFIYELNEKMRNLAIYEADKSIKFLEAILADIKVADSKSIIFGLMEQNYNKKMLATVKSEYILKTIDPAIVPERKYGPKRVIICLLITIGALTFSLVFFTLRFVWRN